jgi:hypothetical protein
MRRVVALAIVALALGLLLSLHPVAGKIAVYTDLERFRADTGPLTDLDFEEDIEDDPAGTTFTDPAGERYPSHAFCSHPTCQPDPENADGGNIAIIINPGASVSFTAPPDAVLFIVEGIGDNPFALRATTASGDSERFHGRGVYYGVAYIGFASEEGISQVVVESVGGTGGPIVFTAILYGDLTSGVPHTVVIGGPTLPILGTTALLGGSVAILAVAWYLIRSRRQ